MSRRSTFTIFNRPVVFLSGLSPARRWPITLRIPCFGQVSNEVVWDVLKIDLPRLRKEVDGLLDTAEG